jgi:hypothetical protein
MPPQSTFSVEMMDLIGACNTPQDKDGCLVAVAIEEASKDHLHQ